MGAAFGGNSSSLFGASGATDFITKFTTGIAIAFMVTSILLVRSYSGFSSSPQAVSNPLEGSLLEGEMQAKEIVPEVAVTEKTEAAPNVEAAKAEADKVAAPAAVAAPEKAAEVPAAPAAVKVEKKDGEKK